MEGGLKEYQIAFRDKSRVSPRLFLLDPNLKNHLMPLLDEFKGVFALSYHMSGVNTNIMVHRLPL